MWLTQRLSVKITTRFILLFLLTFSVVLLAVGSMFTEKLNSELVLVAQQKLNLLSTQLSHSLSDLKSIHFSLVHDAELQLLMHNYQGELESAKAPERNIQPLDAVNSQRRFSAAIRSRLARLVSSYASVKSAVMISNERAILDPIYCTEPYASTMLTNAEYDDFMASQLTGRLSSAHSFPYIVSKPSYEEKTTITYLAHYYDTDNYEDFGAVAIHYSKLALTTDLEPGFSSGFDYTLVADENGNLILRSPTGPDSIPPEILAARSGSLFELDGKTYTMFAESIPAYPHWRIYGVIDYQNILSPVRRILVTTTVTALLALLLTVLTGARITSNITVPLGRMGRAMRQVEKGNWEMVPLPAEPDEVGNLIYGYNQMIFSLQHMEERIREEQNAKKEIEIAMLKSRLDLLQSQINPHFIHNTLNTMNYMAQKDGAHELAKLIVSFNGLLRSSMSIQNMFNPMADEVENLRRYIDIQLTRYEIDLRCTYNITADALLVMLPKLILQPLVENALFHGIVPRGGGAILVRACVEDSRLWVSVIDDGAGIPPEKLQILLEGKLENARGYNSMGLGNVSDRLVLAYGDASRLVIQSSEALGTTISFSIPA